MPGTDFDAGDARQRGREPALSGAMILHGPDKAAVRCLLTNISDEGAELEISGNARVPDRFKLDVPHENRTYRAEVRWRESGRLGVMFHGAEPRTTSGLRLVGGSHPAN